MCAKFVIKGPSSLEGTVKIGGSKNAVLGILPATLLATEPVTLHNVPAIRDVKFMLEILEEFGMIIEGTSGTVRLDPRKLRSVKIRYELARRLRASITILGPALARFGEVDMPHPGGDMIGKRPVDTHLNGLQNLGAKFTRHDDRYELRAKRLQGAKIFLEQASVTGTETIMAAAALARGTTSIRNAASELHVSDLASFLNTLGAQISGIGTNVLQIEGVPELKGGEHTIRADETEAGTFMIAAALTGGKMVLTDVDPENFGMILVKLREAGVNFTTTEDTITIEGPHHLQATDVHTNIWPAFPSDLQPPFTVLMSQAPGMSLIHDWMYEGRFFYTDKLLGMGANITMADPHRIIVFGPTPLHGKVLESPDTRAGITMLVAALIAEGETTIDHVEWIDRGYENIEHRLRQVGADIIRLEERDVPA